MRDTDTPTRSAILCRADWEEMMGNIRTANMLRALCDAVHGRPAGGIPTGLDWLK